MSNPRSSAQQTLPSHFVGIDMRWDGSLEHAPASLVSLTPELLKTHAYLIGGTGCGKTTLIHHLIAQDILLGHSFAVIDMRGDLVNGALELCAGNVDPALVALIDLREKYQASGFDPLWGSGEPYFRALNVLDVVANEAESWGVQLSETLRNALMLLAEAGQPLTKLEHLLYVQDFRLACLERCATESVTAFWQRYGFLSPERQAAFAMPVLNKVSLLFATKTLRSILGNPAPLDLQRHLDTPGSVTLVSLAVDELHAAGRMVGNLVLSAMCREVFARVGMQESRRNPVRLYIDEFEHFTMSGFETILAEGRRFGLSLVLSHQTLSQIPPKMRSLILGNVGVKAIFRCGRADEAVLSRELFGRGAFCEFSALQVGEAALWLRERNPVFCEINEPLVKDAGGRSRKAETFVRSIYEQHGRRKISREKTATVIPATTTLIHSEMEDWLCD